MKEEELAGWKQALNDSGYDNASGVVGFTKGWNAAIAYAKRERIPCDDCFQYYRHGDPTPWECPKCETRWAVRDRKWHRITDGDKAEGE